MKKSKNKYVFHKNPILVFDFLKAKNIPKKSYNNFLNNKNDVIKTDFNVNKFADEIHPITQRVLIKKIIDHKNGIKSFLLKGVDRKLAFFRSGQYISVILDIDNVKISRPYSLVSSPNDVIDNNTYLISVKLKDDGYVSKYMHNSLKEGDIIEVSGPNGHFYYDDLRDSKHILAIAGGIGVTPFISIMKDIVQNNLDVKLTLLYSVFYKKDIVFYDELLELNKSSNIDIKFITTNEKNEGFINKLIDYEMLKEFYNNSSIFICGSKAMINAMLNITNQLNIEKKYIRYEGIEQFDLSKLSEYNNENKKSSYKIKVRIFDQVVTIDGSSSDSILVSLQKAKLHTQSLCLSGSCGWCRIRLISGKLFVPKSADKRRIADKNTNIYHSCCSFPISDVEIESY